MSSQSQLYIWTHPQDANLTVDELRQRLNSEHKETFLKSLRRHVDWMPGLTPFWERSRRQLVQMIDQIDLHWPDLHRMIEEQKAIATNSEPFDLATLTEKERMDWCISNLTNFPHLVASFLQQRVKLFLQTLKKVWGFDYVELWYRYEWQHRGSGHVHGFLWPVDGPDLEGMDLENAEHRAQLTDYFWSKVFAHSPIRRLPRPTANPLQLRGPSVDKDNRTDVTKLLN
jgi:hypothetical protein